jgi:hypothetical protein
VSHSVLLLGISIFPSASVETMNALFISSFIFSVVTSFVIPGSVSPAPDRLNARYPIEFCGIAGSGDVNCYSTTSTDSNIIAVLSAKTSYEFSCRTADGESIDGDR